MNTQNRRGIIKNFIAKIEGREEPDRWILLGNHADAWTKVAGIKLLLENIKIFDKKIFKKQFLFLREALTRALALP